MKKETPLTNLFIEKLKVKMNSLKLKQVDLAKMIGTTKQHANSWFRRTRNPNGEAILRIQKELDP